MDLADIRIDRYPTERPNVTDLSLQRCQLSVISNGEQRKQAQSL